MIKCLNGRQFSLPNLWICVRSLKLHSSYMADSTRSQPVLRLIPDGLCLKHPVKTQALWNGGAIKQTTALLSAAQLPGQGFSPEGLCHRRSVSPKKQPLAHVLSVLGTYFHGIFQHQLWWLILPAGCNFSSAISVIYLLSYLKAVLHYFIVGSGSVSHDWTQPRETGHANFSPF